MTTKVWIQKLNDELLKNNKIIYRFKCLGIFKNDTN